MSLYQLVKVRHTRDVMPREVEAASPEEAIAKWDESVAVPHPQYDHEHIAAIEMVEIP